MNHKWQALKSLTIASMKMYFRNVSAVFFTMVIPILLVVIFGLLSSGNSSSISLGITNNSKTELSKSFDKTLRGIDAFKVQELGESDARDKLGKGKIDLQIVIPVDFGKTGPTGLKPSIIKSYYNQGKPGNGQTAGLIIGQIISEYNTKASNAPQIFTLNNTGIKTNDLGYIDYLLPGIIAMTIMQLGVFSVAFAFVSFKTSGALRRMQATPLHPINFLFAQGVTRVLIGMLQVIVLLSIGVYGFHMHMLGNIFNLLVMAFLGTLTFLAFGFGIAGWAKDENQAAPVANLISFPMLFLSGTFFPRDAFPHYLMKITDYLPLTYLADGMRRIANEGVGLWAVRGDILGLIVWALIATVIATRLFKWE